MRQPIACQLRAASRCRLSRVCRHSSMTVSASAAGQATAAPPRQQRKVAVIGAGAAGLVTIRELLKEGHQVCVYASTAVDSESPPQQESCAAKRTCLHMPPRWWALSWEASLEAPGCMTQTLTATSWGQTGTGARCTAACTGEQTRQHAQQPARAPSAHTAQLRAATASALARPWHTCLCLRTCCGERRDLRTNLPREIMGYLDAPFTPAFMGGASRDPRRYPSHEEVRWLLAASCTASAQLPSFLL